MQRGTTRNWMVALCLVVLMLVSACGANPEGSPSAGTGGDAASPAAGPKQGGTLRILQSAEPTNLDIARAVDNNTFNVADQMYEGLIKMTNEGPKPGLATDVKTSADGLTWTFTLRKDVKFHDGTPFNAQAVKYNFDRIRTGKGFSYANLLAPVTAVNAVDEHTVEFVLSEPFGPFRSILGFIVFTIQSPAALEQHGDAYSEHAAGTGPFKLQSWQRGKELVLVRNEEYWGEKAYLEKLVFTSLSDPTAQVAALEAGDIDLLTSLAASEMPRLTEEGHVQVIVGDTSRTRWLVINNLKKPFDKWQVRQALAYATNRESYIKDLMQGQARTAVNHIGSGVFGRTEMKPYPYDPEKAKQLLAEAGLPNGFNTELSCAPTEELLCQAIAQDLAKAGIKAELKTIEFSTLIQYLFKPAAENEYSLSIVARASQYLDADFPIYTDFHSANWRTSGTNFTFYKNEQVDKLLAATRTEIDPAKRAALFSQAFDQLWHDMPAVPLYHMVFGLGATKDLKGVTTTANERISLSKAWLDR